MLTRKIINWSSLTRPARLYMQKYIFFFLMFANHETFIHKMFLCSRNFRLLHHALLLTIDGRQKTFRLKLIDIKVKYTLRLAFQLLRIGTLFPTTSLWTSHIPNTTSHRLKAIAEMCSELGPQYVQFKLVNSISRNRE